MTTSEIGAGANMGISPVKASVLMAVYNEVPAFLQTAVQSVLKQSFDDFEFIIVDDGSERAETVEMLDRLAASDSRIAVFHEPHRGVTKATNVGLAKCQGEFVFRHDSDDWSEPDRFAKQIDYLHKHPDIAMTGSSIMAHQEDGNRLWIRHFPSTPEDIAKTLPIQNTFNNGSVCFRRQEMNAIGGYHEGFKYSLDYDCYFRMSDRYRVANLLEPLYHYRFTRRSISASKRQEQERFAAIAKYLAEMRRSGIPEDFEAAGRRADEWVKQHKVEAEMVLEADHTMLAGGYGRALGLYARSVAASPLDLKTWVKFARWFVFVSAPPLRKKLFKI